MGKGVTEQKVAVSAAGGGSFKMGKHAKSQIGIQCTPEGTLYITGGLIITALILNLASRFIH